jgi:hypothetical protein
MHRDEGNFLCERTFRDFLVTRENRVWRHLLLITVLVLQFIPEISLIIESYSTYELAKANQIAFVQVATIASAFILIYVNMFWLVPRFLFKKRYPVYFALSGVELIFDFSITLHLQFRLAEFTQPQVDQSLLWLKLLSPTAIIQSLTVPTIFLGATVGILLFKQWLTREHTIAELQQMQFNTELSRLKGQINPHFLFNTLNNINSLIHIDLAKASKIVMGLSDVLRYNVYESNHDRVSLKKEIEVHEHILELEKIRRSQFDCKVTKLGDCNNAYIPPFLFINFIENAIKHSADDRGKSFIEVSFHREENTIDFSCVNSIANSKTKNSGGLGLANVKRRLELLYGNNFQLITSTSENEFKVNLSLPF